ncbi:hypothetical protein KZZ52_33790 [Dactylosporangium sp. AC04546]|uniref:hypothetical protein n=1 Tax=Dactylosporangium sp. AC04546 TaxID=2862460 RepID=UPI001EE09518|nr:hypothetical protein [Dactylosporangium sp. AC04546]WVK78948.1 hypothetical protein KZZ52_33790 [Dactylosporangium sp. AC04546]
MTVKRRWVIISSGVVIVMGLGVAALLFGLRGLEVASWLAGVGGFIASVVTLMLARPVHNAGASAASRSVTAVEVSGVVSTGDNSVIIQQR